MYERIELMDALVLFFCLLVVYLWGLLTGWLLRKIENNKYVSLEELQKEAIALAYVQKGKQIVRTNINHIDLINKFKRIKV